MLRYRIAGTGPSAIVIGSSVYVPRTFSADLRKHLRLVFLDHCGGSPPPSQAVDPEGPRIWFEPHFDSWAMWEGVERNTEMLALAVGRYDVLVAPPSAWNLLRPKFRDLTLRFFERTGHTPQLEQPELFDDELLHWRSLAQNSSSIVPARR